MFDVGLDALRLARAQRVENLAIRRDGPEVAADLPRMGPDTRVGASAQCPQKQARSVLAAYGVATQPEEVLDETRRNVVLALEVRPLAGLRGRQRFIVR